MIDLGTSDLTKRNFNRSEDILRKNGIVPLSPKNDQNKNQTNQTAFATTVNNLNEEQNKNNKQSAQSKKDEIEQLKNRENEVIAHENSHKRVGGKYAKSPSYQYTEGEDGKKYITDGSVSISISEEQTPEATIDKMAQVQRAALAPESPSSADLEVAAKANAIANAATIKLQAQNQNEETEQHELSSESSINTTKLAAISNRYNKSWISTPLGHSINSYN